MRLASDPTLSPDGTTVVFTWRGNLWSVPTAGGDARQLTQHTGTDRQPKISPDGKQLAFVSDRGAGNQIYIMPSEGGFPRQITFHTEGYSLDGWFADGRSLLVRGARDHFWTSAERFFRVNIAQRTADELMFDDYGSEGAPSPDAKRLLFTREGMRWWRKGYYGSSSGQVWLFDQAEKSFRKLVHDPFESRWPLWKPDGRGFYYVSGRSGSFNLWEYDLTSGESQQRTRFVDDSIVFPCISADGSTVVFRCLFDLYRWRPGTDRPPEKIEIRFSGDFAPDTTKTVNLREATEVTFTHDGLEIGFIAGGDLWVMDTVLRDPRRVTDTPEEERNPVFAPDGRSILYVSDAENHTDIWRAERADSKLYWWQNDEFKRKRLTCDEDTESNVTWSPDGSRVAFVKRRGELWTIQPDGQNAKRVFGGWEAPQYQWSPDGQQFVYATSDDDFNRDVWIIAADGSGKPLNVSRHPHNESDPAWSPDGKLIAFTSKRAIHEFDICFVWLRSEDEDLTARDRAVQKAIETLQRARHEASSSATPVVPGIVANASSKASSGEAPSTNAVSRVAGYDLDRHRMHTRVHRISIPNVVESQLFWSPDSKKLAFQATVNGVRGLYTLDIPDNPTARLLVAETGRQPQWLATGNQIVWLHKHAPACVSPDGKLTSYAFNTLQQVDLTAKLQAAFDICWQSMRDYYYDELLGNRNWESIRAKYRDMAGDGGDAETFLTVVQLMLGELNGSHLAFWPRTATHATEPLGQETAHLGLRFDSDHRGLGIKVRDVIPGGPTERSATRIEPGELIVAIDGRAVDPSFDLTSVLNGPLERDIHLKVRDRKNQDRDIVVRPISYDRASDLLYDKWIEDNRQRVARLSQGKLGYLHIRGMDEPSFLQFEEDLYDAGAGRQGLIIDVRDNPGGSTTDHLLTALTQPVHSLTVPRGGGPGYPQDRKIYATWDKPIVVLCNQNSFSNAEIFSHAIKHLHRGPLVGVPTVGGVISTSTREVLDLGTLRLPFRGWFLIESGQDMELNGALPDFVLWPEPGQMPRGEDIQLAKAVEVLAKDVEAWAKRPQPKLIKAAQRPPPVWQRRPAAPQDDKSK